MNTETSLFWGDQVVDELLASRNGQTHFNLNSGFTPSGPPHLGTFRDFATVTVIDRILRERGFSTHAFMLEDDMDPLRRVYPFLDVIFYQRYVGHPLCKIPWKDGTDLTYAKHFSRKLVNFLHEEMGYQFELRPTSETYADQNHAMFDFALRCIDERKKIKHYFDTLKGKEHTEFFFIRLLCERCEQFGTISAIDRATLNTIYFCETCQEEIQTKLQPSNIKLGWRIEWVGKWIILNIDFEPCGKDHGIAGGSLDTGKGLMLEVFHQRPPHSCVYEFIQATKEKITHKSQQLVDDTDEFFEGLRCVGGHVLNYHLFAKQPGRHLILDTSDTIKMIEMFDSGIHRYHQNPSSERAMQLVFWPNRVPKTVVSSRLILQMLDIGKSFEEISKSCCEKYFMDETDYLFFTNRVVTLMRYRHKLKEQRERAKGQKDSFSPEDIRIRFLQQLEADKNWTNERLTEIVRATARSFDLTTKETYREVYQILLGRDDGPRLVSLFHDLGPDVVLKKFRNS